MNLYNEIEPYAAAWLTNLTAAGHIANGRVEQRSIRELRAADVADATQAHFFAGIGVWSYALRLAGWPDDVPVWTGSCPCQPFSAAGKGIGVADERHLWPEWFRLIEECRPPVVFGEQVASADGLGWLDAVRADMEGAGYAVGAADLCAAGVGAPHIRQRLFFVAHAGSERLEGLGLQLRQRGPLEGLPEAGRRGEAGDVADSVGVGRRQGGLHAGRHRVTAGAGPRVVDGDAGPADPWRSADWLQCRDGKSRPVEPGTFPLAHGAPNRVGRLRAYGNAIVPQVAAKFIRAAMEAA